MGKIWRCFPRLSAKPASKAETKLVLPEPILNNDPATDDESRTMNCDSDTSNSVMERIHVHYCVPCELDEEEDSTSINNNDADADQDASIAADEPEHHRPETPKGGCMLPSSFGLACCEPDYLKVAEPDEETFSISRKRNSPKQQQQQQPSQGWAKKRTSPVLESFECIYQEDDVEWQQDAIPMVETTTSLRGDGSPNFCRCSSNRHLLPHLHPSKWPQAPMLLRPKPNGSTRVLGVRKEGSRDYLWKAGQTVPWWEVLQEEWKQQKQVPNGSETSAAHERSSPEYCEFCMVLPINNGCEDEKESLVVDFETPLFQGTLLFRIKGAEGTTKEPHDEKKGYFADKVIRYQAVVRGRFKTPLAFSNLQTGTRLARPCGKLPPKWVMWTAMKVVHFFAPQLQTKLEKVDEPYVLSPLGSAPRTIMVEDETVDPDNTCSVSKEHCEPTDAALSLTGRRNPVENALERARARKRQLDQWFMAKSEMPRAQTDKIYTFEFLQHLFDYHNFSIELGNSFHVKVKDLLYGQPLQLMAEYHRDGQEVDSDNNLWAFEIWNECLWDDAKAVAGLGVTKDSSRLALQQQC